MNSNLSQTSRVHPLFDSNSLYRAASRQSVWSDGGGGSVRQFFEQLRCEPETGIAQNADDRERLPLVCFDLRREIRELHPERPEFKAGSFTGCGKGASELTGTIDEFAINIGGLPDRHCCLVLLLRKRWIEQLGGLLDAGLEFEPAFGTPLPRRTLADQAAALKTITSILQWNMLDPGEPELHLKEYRRASRLALVLSAAAGFERISHTPAGHRDAYIRATVPLAFPSPNLEPGTVVVCCIGPEAP